MKPIIEYVRNNIKSHNKVYSEMYKETNYSFPEGLITMSDRMYIRIICHALLPPVHCTPHVHVYFNNRVFSSLFSSIVLNQQAWRSKKKKSLITLRPKQFMNKQFKSAARCVKQYNCRNTESQQFIPGETNDRNSQKVTLSYCLQKNENVTVSSLSGYLKYGAWKPTEHFLVHKKFVNCSVN